MSRALKLFSFFNIFFSKHTSGPFVVYIIERSIRIIRGSQKTIVIKAIQHPAKTIEIRLKKVFFF